MNHFLRAGLVASLLLSGAVTNSFANDVNTMSLVGTGTTTAAPDMANLSSGVITRGKTAGEALALNNGAMAKLVTVLKDGGVAEKDLQTSGFAVQPQYVYSDKRDENGYNKMPEIVGYQVSNNITVRVRDLDVLGTLLDKMVNAGSNTINGVSFAVAAPKALLNTARRNAMADAVAKANLYADAANVCLASVKSISENGGYQPQPKMMRAMAMDMAESAVPVQAGEVGYDMSVSVTWEITDGPCA